MALRIAAVILFLYSAPILLSVQADDGEPEVARERLLSLLEG